MRAFVLLVLCCLTLPASAQTKVRLGGVSVAATYARFAYPYSSYPYFWDPWYLGPPIYGFPYAMEKGEVKLQTADKTAEVFIDGAYAGTADKLKSIWLEPGAYTLSVQAAGRPPAERRVYVLTGKTLRIKL